MRKFKDILTEVTRACNDTFYSGYKNVAEEVLRSATQIYISEMQIDYQKEKDNKLGL